MKENKTSEAQIRANRKWEEKNRGKANLHRNRSSARTFCRKYAEEEDIYELIEIYNNENENSKNKLELINKKC